MKVEAIPYKRSYDSVNRQRWVLKLALKRTPEERQRLRESLTYRLEMLNIIRMDLRACIRLA